MLSLYIHFTLHDIYTLYFTCSLYIYTLLYMLSLYIHFTLHDDKKTTNIQKTVMRNA